MGAFLLRLPELTPEEYRRLAYGEPAAQAITEATAADAISYLFSPLSEPLELIIADCARCHGPGGNGRGLGAFPKLAGQSEAYLLASLQAYARGQRHSGIMEPVAASLNDETLRALARYYAGLPPENLTKISVDDAQAARESIESGRALAEGGAPEQGIPSCIDCHGPRTSPRNPMYPRLAGQYADYLALQLELFRDGKRGGTPYAHIMENVAGRLTQQQIRDAAAYFSSIVAETEANDRPH